LLGEGEIEGFNSKERVVVLTGANSGGKTSLLNLIIQIQLLAQMGLPVPAKEVKTEVIDEIHFFARKKAVYGAGAFESMLNNLTFALAGKGRKLILVDEFEAVTEPGAATKMLAAFLRIALEKGYYMVVVSHLAENLELDFVRVDGIEASGLDERLELIVDRQPKFGRIGKSTPELIVERAYRLSKGEKKEIFKILLNTFRKD
jgi:dsDNA-specific endonuclease/ATPase MutS2